MQIALNWAQNGKGQTFPNPCVGAVLCDGDQIIASARTNNGGRPHAETLVLQKAKDKDYLITPETILYITLEPCAHHGETPPCVEAIIQANIKQVVIGTKDADAKVAGEGIASLEKANIEVVYEPLDGKIEKFYQGYSRQRKGELPFVALKIASTLDGITALGNGQSQWITGDMARQYGHLLRARSDCIITAAGTVLFDNPRLNVRLAGYESYQTMRVLVAGQRAIPASSNIFDPQYGEVMIVVSENSPHLSDYQEIAEQNPQQIIVQKMPSENHHIDLKALLKLLGKFGVSDILIEAGAGFTTQFLQQNLADRLYLFQNHSVIGGDGRAMIDALMIEYLPTRPKFELIEEKHFSSDKNSDDNSDGKNSADHLLILDRR